MATFHYIMGKQTNHPFTISSHTHYRPARKGTAWWIKNADTGEIIDSYSPPQIKKQTVDTPRKGAWCNTVNKLRG